MGNKEPDETTAGFVAEREVDLALTGRVKHFAFKELGADLVGVAHIGRFAHAPERMSPQGILPSARSVVVMAIHHPDACIELGGVEHPQKVGPYRVQYLMNSRLDEMSYRLACFLEGQGYAAVPIVSSNIWRYKGYKDLTAHFAPDISHLYAAVAAGLADLGYSGLAITPEYGARQRYVSVITDAPLQPSPLLEPGSVCDQCRLCVRHCPAEALSKEVEGLDELWIEGKCYTKAHKNLWRCSWGEHFGLDLDLAIPEHVDEAIILESVRRYGVRGGEMGFCLRYCVPKPRRFFDLSYTNAPRRRRTAPPEEDQPHRGILDSLLAAAYGQGADFVITTSGEDLAALGISVRDYLPDGASAVTVGLRYRLPEGPDRTAPARSYLVEGASYDVARALERLGYSAICCTHFPEKTLQQRLEGIPTGWGVQTATVITAARFASSPCALPLPQAPRLSPREMKTALQAMLRQLGADAFGVAPVERLAALQPQLATLFEGMPVLLARDRARPFHKYDPEVHEDVVRVQTPGDHLPGARSVVVIGLRLPHASVSRTALPPAEAVGPYAFAQYESANLLRLMAYRALRWLEDRGYRGVLTFDLCGTGSVVGNPRGEQPDAFANRFAAVAAGLGVLSKAGFVVTPEFGPRMRFVALVTDAEIEPDPVCRQMALVASCEGCRRCLDTCRTGAFRREEVVVHVEGVPQRFHPIERVRCDWAKRYSLVGDEGVNYLGWNLDLPVPDAITAEALAEGLRQHPPIPKYRPCNFEACLLACPLTR